MTRELLTMSGSFHQYSDVNRLYAKRKQGGRGLKSIEDLYKTRTISLAEHISEAAGSHELLNLLRYHEENGIVRLEKKFKQRITDITQSSNVVEGTKQIHKKVWKENDAHGYHQKQIEERENIDTSKTNNWKECGGV